MKKLAYVTILLLALTSFGITAPQILFDNPELADKVNKQYAEESLLNTNTWETYQLSKPMIVKNCENRLLNWFRTRIPEMNGITRFNAPSGYYSTILSATVMQYLVNAFDTGSTNYTSESITVQDCRSGLVTARKVVNAQLIQMGQPKMFLDESEEAALFECAWHPDAEWINESSTNRALKSFNIDFMIEKSK